LREACMIKAILATDDNNGIAKDGKIPWYSKEDFKFFKDTTIGSGRNVIVMGRKTQKSLPRFPLPERKNVVFTRRPVETYHVNNWRAVHQISEGCDDVFIIGGSDIYQQAFEHSIPEEIYISRIPGNYDCDQFIDMGLIQENYVLSETTPFEEFSLEIWKRKD
jgi:dihydrofolate reductase